MRRLFLTVHEPDRAGSAVHPQTPCRPPLAPAAAAYLRSAVGMLLRHLREDAPEARTEELLHWVLVDSRNGRYEGGLGPEVRQALADMGVPLLERDMVREEDPQRHDPELTARALLGLLPDDGRAWEQGLG